MKYSVPSDRDFKRILKQNGYEIIRTNGDHTIWRNAERKDSITVNKNINPIVAKRLVKQHNLKEN